MGALQGSTRGVTELRAEGRRLTGTVIRYGSVGVPGAVAFSEEFARGAFARQLGKREHPEAVMLNVQHDRRRPIARWPGTMALTDGPDALRMVAVLPETRDADDVLALVRSGVMVGLSVGFVADSDRMQGDRRIVERATLDHIAVVDRPAYQTSTVDAREWASANGNGGIRFWGYWGTGEAPNSAHNATSKVIRRLWL